MLSENIRAALDKAISEQAQKLIEQRASDFETYLTVYGQLAGLRAARVIVDDEIRRENDR
jgi:hypothetical protein